MIRYDTQNEIIEIYLSCIMQEFINIVVNNAIFIDIKTIKLSFII